MKQQILVGTTSKRMVVFVANNSVTTGAGLTGLAFNTASLTAYYWRENTGNSGGVSITLATSTLGTFTSGAFKEIDATNLPGFYEIGIPNAALASGATWVVLMYKGATNMAPVTVEIQLVGYDPTDSVRLGLSALPNGPLMVKKNQAYANFVFPMYNSSSHAAQTGLTVTAQRSQDGGSIATCTNAVAEIGVGLYQISFTAAEMNCGTLAVKFSATGAEEIFYTFITQP